ncbi:hypothetical protein CDCA_CDCA02G0598 [Cyanidium caldarium]|uniref:Uncharacterized protein n=1 Tax=Cyanidium caldarium TaxID=2771 RepID=A0AAV9IRN3_CYACA|nr:hypothetical protein CDCA_CDCA02G0598 [Cyanidium caldarium]
MSSEPHNRSVGTSVSSLYSKAKQRVLNRLGRRTHLTRNPKVDSLSDIQSGISHDEGKLASRINAYRRALRDASIAGMDLQLAYLNIYKKNVGSLRFSPDGNEYAREPTAAQAHYIQTLERELNEMEVAVKRELERFNARLKDYAGHPLTNKSIEEEDELQRIDSLKNEYRKARTVYSDRAIEVEAGGTNQAALTESYQEYMRKSEMLCEEMIRYQDRVAREIGSKVRGFFEAQCKIYGALNEKYQALLPLARQVESLPSQATPPPSWQRDGMGDDDGGDVVGGGAGGGSLAIPAPRNPSPRSADTVNLFDD